MTPADSGADYVDIIRHVRDLADERATTDTALRWLGRKLRPNAGTLADLLQSETLEPVVLVGPSGTGKTTEFRQHARRLRALGRPAAFAEALAIVASPEMELDREEQSAFQGMVESTAPGVLFVDAVDELHLRQQTIEQLFRRLAREVDFEARPVRLIFSARNGAWSPAASRQLRHLLKGIGVEKPKLVVLEPLDLPAIKKLAAFYGVDNVDAFAAEFEQEEIQDLLELRPADVKLLAELRRRGGKLTKWTHLLQEYVDASFIDERPDRIRGQRLSTEVGRRGLQRSASATLLMGIPHISTSSVALLEGAISSRRLFADWPASELAEFFENPLFVHKGRDAEAVQLPQGTLSHFLAARWFAERVRHGLRGTAVRDAVLVSVTGDGRYQIPKAHRRVVGWLASEVPDFRQLIASDHPEVVLYEGDPDRLSDAEIRDGLGSLCEAMAAGLWDGWATPATLRRLARPSLEVEVRSLLDRYRGMPAVAAQLLKLVEHGKYRTCAGLALELANESNDLVTIVAIPAFAAAAPDERAQLVGLTTRDDDYVRLSLLRVLVPDLLHSEALVSFVLAGGGYALHQGLSEVAGRMETADLDALLTALAPVLAASAVTAATEGALEAAVPIALACLERGESQVPSLIETLAAIERHDHRTSVLSAEEEVAFRRLLARHNETRRRLWVHRFQAATQSPNAFESVLQPRFGDAEGSDLEWLWSLVGQQSGGRGDARIVLRRVWDRLPPAEQRLIGDRIAVAELTAMLSSWAEQDRGADEERRRREEAARAKEDSTRKSNEEALAPRRAAIESGDDLGALEWAWRHLEGAEGESEKISLERLRLHVGHEYVESFLRGLRAVWRKISVPIPDPGEGHPLRYLLGLTGMTLAARSGLDLSTLSQQEAQRAARFGLYALNVLPFWYGDLSRLHASEVRAALRDAITLEWAHTSEAHRVLRFASRADSEVAAIVRSIVLDLLEAGPPAHPKTLDYAVDAILTSTHEFPRVQTLVRREIDRAGAAMPDPNWLRAWAHVDPEAAAAWISKRVESDPDVAMPVFLKTATLLEQDLNELFGRVAATSLLSPRALGRWVRLLLALVRPQDDLEYQGARAMGDRDQAEALRHRCLTRLASDPTPEARAILLEMQADPALAFARATLDQRLEDQQEAAVEAAITRWAEEDVLRLERNDEKLPRTLVELFELVKAHLLHVGGLLENDDFSYRELFRARGKGKEKDKVHTAEREIQLWVASCLRQRARGLYSVVRENVVDDDKEVDISAFAAGVGHVPVEIKPLGKYSPRDLVETMERQLLGQYMQPADRRCGILLLVRRERLKWNLGLKSVDLQGLVDHLRANARALGARHGKDIFVAVIDLLATPAGQGGAKPATPQTVTKTKVRLASKAGGGPRGKKHSTQSATKPTPPRRQRS